MSQACSQLTDKLLFQLGETDRQCLWRVRAVGNAGTTAPAPDCGLADAQLGRQFCDRPFAALNVTADLRCGRGVGVQAQLHDARRSRIYEMPRSTPIPSNQSSGTKHLRGGERGESTCTKVLVPRALLKLSPRRRLQGVRPHTWATM